jgi:NmrA-like family
MAKMFLITGSTGTTGSKTVKFLLDTGAQVRAFVHNEDERSAALAAQGAEIVRGDLLDFEAVRSALEGAQGAYFVFPIRPGILQARPISLRQRRRLASRSWSADQVLGPASHWHPHIMVYLPGYETLLGTKHPQILFHPSGRRGNTVCRGGYPGGRQTGDKSPREITLLQADGSDAKTHTRANVQASRA